MNNIFDIYKKIYKLDTLDLDYIKDNSISFIFFDNDGKYYLNETHSFVTYSSLLQLKMVDLIYNIEKIYSLKIYNFFPLCFTKNNSIIMACKIKEKSSKLKLIDKKKIKEVTDLLDKESKYYTDDYDDERLLIEKYNSRYRFYHNFIKRYFLTEKKRRKKEYLKLINELITTDISSIIDVSCGDNDDVFRSCKDVPLVVGNDINAYHIKRAQNRYRNVVFTNNNMLHLKYNDYCFDVSYCKNTLHHLNGTSEIKLALKNLLKVSNKVIIVEIEDPKVTGGMPRFLNKYLYIKFLKDAGKKFLDFKGFKNAIDSSCEDKCNISYLTFENILGKYMIAVIEKR